MATVIIPEDHSTLLSKMIEGSNSWKGNLFLGNYQAAIDKNILNTYKISAILTIMNQLEVKHAKAKHLIVAIDDSPLQNIGQHFSQTNAFIHKHLQEGNVLVHCKAGISRSSTLIVAYFMKFKQYTFKKALSKVQQKRNIVHPNQGFVLQLKNYQKKLEKAAKNI